MKITRDIDSGDRCVIHNDRVATPRGGGHWHVEQLDSHGDADLLEAWVTKERARELLINAPADDKETAKPKLAYCTYCGSTDIMFDATVKQNPETGEPEIATVHTHTTCGNCEGECSVEFKEI